MILGINFYEHPSRHRIFVFEFTQKERADYFEALLTKEKIDFEREVHLKNEVDTIFYGVDKMHLKQAKHANYLASGKYRKRFISDPILRYFTLIFAAIVAGLIILGILLGS